MAKSPPIAALHMNVGASRPPDVPDPSEITRAANFAIITTNSSFHMSWPLRMSPIVSYPTPNTRGTKKPMMPRASAPIGGQPAQRPQKEIKRQRMRDPEVHGPDLKHRPRTQKLHMNRRRQRAGNDQRNKRPRLEFEKEQLNRKNYAGDRSVKRRRHPGRGAASQQHLPFDSRRGQYPSDQ